MAKKKPYLILETKEDFDRLYKEGYKCGYDIGKEDERLELLMIFQDILEMVERIFTADEISDAAYLCRKRDIAKWKKEHNAEVKIVPENKDCT